MTFRFRNTYPLALLIGFILLLAGAGVASAQGLNNGGNGDSAYTLWAVIFNSPENCTDPCGPDDIFGNPVPPQSAVVFLAGQRVQSNGRASLSGALGEGATIGAQPLPTQALLDTDGAEVHLILRSHGDFVPGLADAQISSFGGGCDVQDCEDKQFVIFLPGQGDVQTESVFRFSDGQAVEGAWATLYREDDGIRVAVHSRLP